MEHLGSVALLKVLYSYIWHLGHTGLFYGLFQTNQSSGALSVLSIGIITQGW